MSDRLKIGVIGVGNMGRNHMRILHEQINEFDLVGFYDNRADNAQKISEMYNTPAFSSMEELFEKIEAVDIVVPSSLHVSVAVQAARAGLHAFVEKPLGLNAEEAETIAAAFRKAGKVLMVGHVERYNPVISELIKILSNEEIIAIDAHRCSPFDKRISDADVIQDLMIHDIDIVCNALQSGDIRSIEASGVNVRSNKKMDYVQALVRFSSNVIASITASRITEEKIRTIEVHTKNAYIYADLLNRTLKITRRTSYKLDTGYTPTYTQENVVERVVVPFVEPLRVELLHYRDCVLNGKEPLTNATAAIRTLKIADRISGQTYSTM